jgi:pimeloyl-ACP methyl ester carboxylesterase
MARMLTFLPGTMCDHRVWAGVRACLEPRLSTAYLPIESQATREGMLALLASAAEPAPLHLVAFSMGGYLALDFALEYPDRVASLVTVAS